MTKYGNAVILRGSPNRTPPTRLTMAQALVKKTLLLPQELVEEFESRHPSHGSFTWFVRTALEKYNELNKTDPDELLQLAVGELDRSH